MNRVFVALFAGLSLSAMSMHSVAQGLEDGTWYVLSDPVNDCVVADHPANDVYKRQIAGPYATQTEAAAALKDATICEESPTEIGADRIDEPDPR